MQITINRRLLKHNCVLLCILLFLFQFIYLTVYTISQTHSSSGVISTGVLSQMRKNLNDNNTRPFKHLRPFSYDVSCPNLFESDPDELKHALNLVSTVTSAHAIADNHYNITQEQCDAYRLERFNETFHHEDTKSNQQYPLAFSILMHENVEQFERLLRVMYRPQNFYCVHVDRDASLAVFEGVQAISQCFRNVFLSSKRENVLYATISRLQADLNCMSDLLNYPSWKYLLNLANTELPLKTNSELVKILSIYRGYNDIEGRWKSKNVGRTAYAWQITNSTGRSAIAHLRKTNETKTPPPGNVEIVKGSAYGAFSRAFVEFLQTSSIASELLDWSRDTYSPDEHYWATLNYNTHLRAPGGYKAKSDPTAWTARYVNWSVRNCSRRVRHGICVFGSIDLPSLYNRHELFANKFYLKMDPIAYQCLEELLINRSKLDLPLNDATFYRQMPFLVPF